MGENLIVLALLFFPVTVFSYTGKICTTNTQGQDFWPGLIKKK